MLKSSAQLPHCGADQFRAGHSQILQPNGELLVGLWSRRNPMRVASATLHADFTE
ncbi:hypothetical protein [Streptomyces sp. NPDC020681]|uniref:hypothetical protein n=1 Tax=Streptomyces sp. NPDC020681 TaxID=3365083 RepID=UPI0037B4DC81